LHNNQITDIFPISGLTNLTNLSLYNNQISDIYPLVENTGLGSGDDLYLNPNPFSQEALNVHIPILESRGFATLEYPTTPNNYAACYPNPARNETGVFVNNSLEWQGNFIRNADYDVWLGETADNLVNVGNGTLVSDTLYSFTPTLNANTDYWWKVRAVTATDTIWSGLWNFTTGEEVYFTVDFTATYRAGYLPLSVQFTDTTDGTPISWQWDFDNDGNIDATDQHPNWTYNVPGTYTVSLTVNNGTSLESTETKSDFIFVFDSGIQPIHSFDVNPINLGNTFYDYMPGSYNACPIQVQDNGSVYISYHAQETEGSNRYVYTSYIDNSGLLVGTERNYPEDYRSGYAGSDIDPNSGDPLVAWHGDVDNDGSAEISIGYDNYHQSGALITLSSPFEVMDNEDYGGTIYQ